MKLLFDYNNIYLDSASAYDISEVNESEYVKELLYQVKKNLGSYFESFQFYILFSHDPLIVPETAGIEAKNKILFWFSDESGTFPKHLVNNYCLIFKSYIHKEYSNVYCNPLGYVNEFVSQANKNSKTKDIEIFFSGNLNANRYGLYKFLFFRKYNFLKLLKIIPDQVLIKLFQKLKINKLGRGRFVFLFSNKFKSGLRYEKYFEYLLRSKFILCPKGFHSNETFRHIEALHAGGIIISEEMPMVSIYKNNPFLTYKSYPELKKIFRMISKNNFDIEKLRKLHKFFYYNRFTVDAIAKRISTICFNNYIKAE